MIWSSRRIHGSQDNMVGTGHIEPIPTVSFDNTIPSRLFSGSEEFRRSMRAFRLGIATVLILQPIHRRAFRQSFTCLYTLASKFRRESGIPILLIWPRVVCRMRLEIFLLWLWFFWQDQPSMKDDKTAVQNQIRRGLRRSTRSFWNSGEIRTIILVE